LGMVLRWPLSIVMTLIMGVCAHAVQGSNNAVDNEFHPCF
jgi:hypothetical protein